MAEQQDQNFYMVLAKALFIMNIIALFFSFAILLFYAVLQYAHVEFLDVADTLLNDTWYGYIVRLFELLLSIPAALDTLFMAIIFLGVSNIFYYSYQTKRGGWLGFFFFLALGLPIWLWVTDKVVDMRNTLITYIDSAVIIKPNTTFFDYFVNYSIEITAVIFTIALIIHRVDWENVRERLDDFRTTGIDDTPEIDEVFR